MPQLNWDETDFIECLEVVPDVEEYEVRHVYEVEKNGIVLTLTVWQLESVVQIELHQQNVKEPLMKFALFVRERVRYVNDKRGQYLEFRDVELWPNRFASPLTQTLFDKAKLHGVTVQLQVKPHIQIRYDVG